jgi:hypothetical protein
MLLLLSFIQYSVIALVMLRALGACSLSYVCTGVQRTLKIDMSMIHIRTAALV